MPFHTDHPLSEQLDGYAVLLSNKKHGAEPQEAEYQFNIHLLLLHFVRTYTLHRYLIILCGREFPGRTPHVNPYVIYIKYLFSESGLVMKRQVLYLNKSIFIFHVLLSYFDLVLNQLSGIPGFFFSFHDDRYFLVWEFQLLYSPLF